MKAVGYARVARENPEELQRQQDRIGRWATANGFELTAMYADTCSGLIIGPGLQQALNSEEKIITGDYSRITRQCNNDIPWDRIEVATAS